MPQSVIVMLVIWVMTVSSARAESWLDAWSRQAISTAPNQYQGNGRGYLSGGRLSMRFNQAGEIPPPIASFSPPSVDTGCGGIDIFGGALGFITDGEYMVERYVNIAQGAVASYAFSLALGLLCDKCESISRALSSAATELNKLQFSDCQAAEGVKTVMDDLLFDKAIETKKRTKAIRNAIGSGADEFRYRVEREGSYTDEIDNLHAACPADYSAIFHTDGSLIGNILRSLGEDQQWVEVMSGFFGDVRIRNQNEYEFIEPCFENINVADLTTHQFHIRDQNWQCVPIGITFPNQPDTYANIYEYIYRNSSLVAQYYYRNDPHQILTPENESFRNSTSPPIVDILAYELSQSGVTFEPADFAEDYSHYYAYDYLNDLIWKMRTTIRSLFASAKTIWYRTQIQDGAAECEKELTAGIISHLDRIEVKSDQIHAQVNAIYRDKRDEKIARFRLAEQFREIHDEVKNSTITKIQPQSEDP